MKYLDLAIANETIKTTDIKGKEYAEVNQRIKAFRMVYPDGIIDTKMLSNENGVCIFKAQVGYYEYDGCVRWLATGYAYEKENSTFINKTSYIENCETSAVGRALGIAGFGIDVSVASAEEVQNAIYNQDITKEEADSYKLTFGKYQGKTIKEIEKEDKKYIDWLFSNTKDETIIKVIELTTGRKMPTEEESKQRISLMVRLNELVEETECDYNELLNHYGVSTNNQMTIAQLQEAIKVLEKRLK